jgi:hypothetical protein
MGAPGVSPMQVKTGKPKPPAPISSECKELEKKNDDSRGDLKEKTRDQSVVGPNQNGRGTTVSSCKVVPGRPRTRVAHSNQKAYEKSPNIFTPGGDQKVREGAKKTTCNYTHPDPAMQKSGHAEARLLDSMNGKLQPGAKITFNIDWRKRKGRPSKMPCMTCHRYMCQVQKQCEVEIFLCDKNNRKHKVPCEPSRTNRQALKRKVDSRR